MFTVALIIIAVSLLIVFFLIMPYLLGALCTSLSTLIITMLGAMTKLMSLVIIAIALCVMFHVVRFIFKKEKDR